MEPLTPKMLTDGAEKPFKWADDTGSKVAVTGTYLLVGSIVILGGGVLGHAMAALVTYAGVALVSVSIAQLYKGSRNAHLAQGYRFVDRELVGRVVKLDVTLASIKSPLLVNAGEAMRAALRNLLDDLERQEPSVSALAALGQLEEDTAKLGAASVKVDASYAAELSAALAASELA